jgi:hypothetical protein
MHHGILTAQSRTGRKEGRRCKELLDSNIRKMPFKLHESCTGIASMFSHDSKFPAHAADFEENVRPVISMQMNGIGGEEAAAMLGMCYIGRRLACVMYISLLLLSKKINVAQDAIRAGGIDGEIKITEEVTMDVSYEQWLSPPQNATMHGHRCVF